MFPMLLLKCYDSPSVGFDGNSASESPECQNISFQYFDQYTDPDISNELKNWFSIYIPYQYAALMFVIKDNITI